MATDRRGLIIGGPRAASGSLSPTAAAARLAALRAAYVPERDVDARARLAHERPVSTRPFAVLVSQRLRELRALCELARHLHEAASVAKPVRATR
jgi:hypothetical protein